MLIYFDNGETKELNLPGNKKMKYLLKELGINILSVIVINKDKQLILTPDSPINNEDKLEIRKIISGG